jgi:hypothetical protein
VAPQKQPANEEKQRLEEDRVGRQQWRKWGPYLSERQWGTVREDYSPHGDSWVYDLQPPSGGGNQIISGPLLDFCR